MPKKKYSKRRSVQSWRGLKRKSRLKRKLRIFSLALLVIISTGICYSLFNIWKYYVRPEPASASDSPELLNFYQSSGGYSIFLAERVGSLDGDWLIKDPKVLMVNKSLKKIAVAALPADLRVGTDSYGEVSLASLPRLFSKKDAAPFFYLENTLGMPLEGIFISPDGLLSQNLGEESFLKMGRIFSTYLPHKSEVVTNMPLTKLFDLSLLYSGLMESDLLEIKWDPTLAQAYLNREEFLKESLRLEIINASSLSGYGSYEARKLESLGIKISALGSAEDFSSTNEISENTIYLRSKSYIDLKTVSYLMARYNANVEVNDDCRTLAVLVLVHEP